MRPTFVIIALGLLVTVFAGSLQADIVFLKNSRYYKGKVTGQDLNNVQFVTNGGLKLNIAKSQIKKILYIPVDRQAELDREAKQRAEERKRREREAAARRRALERERLRKQREAAERRRKAAEEARKKREAEEKARLEKNKTRRNEALWRSAILPGWGQYYLGAEDRGYALGGAAAGAFLLWFFFDMRYNAAVAEHEENTTLALAGANNTALAAAGFAGAQSAQADADKNGVWASRFSLILLGVYLYNLYDVWFNYTALTGEVASDAREFTRRGGFTFALDRRPADHKRLKGDEDRLMFSYGIRF